MPALLRADPGRRVLAALAAAILLGVLGHVALRRALWWSDGLGLCASGFFAGAAAARARARVVLANVALIALILIPLSTARSPIGKVALAAQRHEALEGVTYQGTCRDTPLPQADIPGLGRAMNPHCRVDHTRAGSDGQPMLHAVYTTDENGLRSAPMVGRDAPEAVLFFGDSFTWGDWVNDEEVYPYRFEVARQGRIRGLNFGFSGWGPHQMLRILELGRERAAVGRRQVRHAVYFGIPDHLNRIVGRSFWAQGAPRYRLDGGQLRSDGQFAAPQTGGADERAETQLLIAIVARARALLRERYGADLLVVWCAPSNSPSFARFEAGGLEALPGPPEICDPTQAAGGRYLLPDGHPNPEGHRLIAAQLLEALKG
jgi:hypothetical protein